MEERVDWEGEEIKRRKGVTGELRWEEEREEIYIIPQRISRYSTTNHGS